MSTQGKPEVITARAHNIYIGSYWEPICNQRLSQFVVIRAHNIYKADSSLLISICWSDLPFLCLLHPKAQQQHGDPRGLLMSTYWYDHCGQHETENIMWHRPPVWRSAWLEVHNYCLCHPLWSSTGVGYCPETFLCIPDPRVYARQRRYMDYINAELYSFLPVSHILYRVRARGSYYRGREFTV